MMVTLYNVKTGVSAKVEGVDAREYVKTGGWSNTPPFLKTPEKPVIKTKKAKVKK